MWQFKVSVNPNVGVKPINGHTTYGAAITGYLQVPKEHLTGHDDQGRLMCTIAYLLRD